MRSKTRCGIVKTGLAELQKWTEASAPERCVPSSNRHGTARPYTLVTVKTTLHHLTEGSFGVLRRRRRRRRGHLDTQEALPTRARESLHHSTSSTTDNPRVHAPSLEATLRRVAVVTASHQGCYWREKDKRNSTSRPAHNNDQHCSSTLSHRPRAGLVSLSADIRKASSLNNSSSAEVVLTMIGAGRANGW